MTAVNTEASSNPKYRPLRVILRYKLVISLGTMIVLAGGLFSLISAPTAGNMVRESLECSGVSIAGQVEAWRTELLGVTKQFAVGLGATSSLEKRRHMVDSTRALPGQAKVMLVDANGIVLAGRSDVYAIGQRLHRRLSIGEDVENGIWSIISAVEGGQFLVVRVPLGDSGAGEAARHADIWLDHLGLVSTVDSVSKSDALRIHMPIHGSDWEVVVSARRRTVYAIYLAVPAGCVLAVILLYLLLPLIIRRVQLLVNNLKDAVRALNAGDFASRTNISGSGDLSLLTERINHLASVLDSSFQEVEFAAQLVSTSAEEILSSAEAQEETANRQSTSLNETAATAEEMNLSAQQAASNAEDVVERTESASQQILELSEKAQQISRATEFIDEISHQIRMLALNAPIQSAKAGGSGGGFAVLASEIRRLADDTRNSTSEIETLIQDMQEATSTSVMTMEQTVESVKAIGLAMAQQNVATGHVTEAMIDMNTGMSQTVESTVSTVESGQALNRLADTLRQSIDRVSGKSENSVEGTDHDDQEWDSDEQAGHMVSSVNY
jgi:methyl-accepting chemotaxis protein